MADYRNLEVWQLAHQTTLSIYRVTRQFPKTELYGLTTQLRRAAASIPANIAEGAGRGSDKDFARFVRIATGSANEVEYHLLLALDLGFIDEATWEEHQQLIDRVRSMLSRLAATLNESPTG